MALSEQLADFVVRSSYDSMSEDSITQLKVRILDSIGCAIGSIGSEIARLIRDHIEDFGGGKQCALIGGGRSSPDRAAFYNSALVRYLDFNDSYMAKGETCHPSDNLGAVLAACEYAGKSGRDLVTSLAVAYQVQCRLSDVAPVRSRGFDHTTQGSYAVAAGVSKAIGLDTVRTSNAISICGTAFNALRVTRTGELSNWKGLAYPNTAFCCMHGTFLAMRGITGPKEVFEGNKGFMDAISGRFTIDWLGEDLERVKKTIIKKFNAEIHSQSAIEGVLELKAEHGFSALEVQKVEVDIFDVAYNIIGGGEEGDKTIVRTKEDADHSLPYMVAAAILDGAVMPEQYSTERIRREDVQGLLRKVIVRPDSELSRLFPERHACRIRVTLKDGRSFYKEKEEYEGFHTNPMGWDGVVRKFSRLTRSHLDEAVRRSIVDAVRNIENITVAELMGLLAIES